MVNLFSNVAASVVNGTERSATDQLTRRQSACPKTPFNAGFRLRGAFPNWEKMDILRLSRKKGTDKNAQNKIVVSRVNSSQIPDFMVHLHYGKTNYNSLDIPD
ncbi:MAG: hypothetical protein R2792_14570 [Saprospiraceae bacterium]